MLLKLEQENPSHHFFQWSWVQSQFELLCFDSLDSFLPVSICLLPVCFDDILSFGFRRCAYLLVSHLHIIIFCFFFSWPYTESGDLLFALFSGFTISKALELCDHWIYSEDGKERKNHPGKLLQFQLTCSWQPNSQTQPCSVPSKCKTG